MGGDGGSRTLFLPSFATTVINWIYLYMKNRKKSTISLTCTKCGDPFERTVSDHQRRLNKLPDSTNFFCGRSCSSSYRNSHRANNGNHLKEYRFVVGDTARMVYDRNFTWYIHRLTTDRRRGLKYSGDRLELQSMLMDQWKIQQGRCAITGVHLQLRIGASGQCDTDNVFQIASVDRINNELSYTKGNVQWVSMAINRARGNTDLSLFKEHLSNLVQTIETINQEQYKK